MNFELRYYVTRTSTGLVDHEASDSLCAAGSRSLCGAAETAEERRRHEPGPGSLRVAPLPPRAPSACRPLAHLGKSRRTTQEAVCATNRPWRAPARAEARSCARSSPQGCGELPLSAAPHRPRGAAPRPAALSPGAVAPSGAQQRAGSGGGAAGRRPKPRTKSAGAPRPPGEGSARRGRPRGLTWDICGRKLISLRLMEWLRRLLSSWHSSTPSRSVCARSKTWAVSQVTRWLGGSTLQLISHCPHCFHGSIPATLRPRRPPLRPPPPPPRPARPASHRSAPARPVRRGPAAPSRGLRCVRARLRAGPAVRSP